MAIEGRSLTTCEVAGDGRTIRLGLVDESGRPTSLQLSIGEAGALAMTLPSLIEKAMRAHYGDTSLRYAYPLGSWSLEQSSDPNKLMMTLRTTDGFGVCFSMQWAQGGALGETLSRPPTSPNPLSVN